MPDSRPATFWLRTGRAQDVTRAKAQENYLCVMRTRDASARHQRVDQVRLQTGACHPVRHVPPNRALRGGGGIDATVRAQRDLRNMPIRGLAVLWSTF